MYQGGIGKDSMKKGKGFEKYSEKMQPLFETVGKLTRLQRIAIALGAFAVLIGGFVFLSIMPQMEEIDKIEKKIEKTQKELKVAKRKAAQLDKLKTEWEKKQRDFEAVMDALPDKKEIPSLLGEISAAGRNAGLDFQSFTPQAEISRKFYAEIPVSIKISGTFDRLKVFFEKVADMSRVVNLKNIQLSSSEGGDKITMSCTAVTYRFLSKKGKK